MVDDPATGESIASVASAAPQDTTRAVDAAAQAMLAWTAAPPRHRAEVLRRAFASMTEEFAHLISLENGKALADARAEVAYAAELLRWYAEEAVRVVGIMQTAPSGATSSPGSKRTAMAAVAAMRRQLAAPPTIPHLAVQLGVSERTLLSVFHGHFSTTPSAYFKRMRLEAVHDALLCSRPQDTTVTRVAARVGGFFHPGRFAGEYFAMFGEHPMDTLRASAAHSGDQAVLRGAAGTGEEERVP